MEIVLQYGRGCGGRACATAPTTTQAGQMATVTAVVVNQSSEVAAAFRVGFYLGAGPSVAAGDALLGSCAAAGLAPNGSFTCNKSVGLPANIQPGQYVIGAIADDEIQLADTNRANNTRTSDFGAVTISNPLVRPAIPTNGVVSAASYAGGGIAPGEIIAIFGNNLGPAAVLFPGIGPSGLVDSIAGGTRVLFDGVAAPMVYALAGQVSAVVPFAVANRASTLVQVEYLGTRSEPILMTVASAVPGIFTLNKTGCGPDRCNDRRGQQPRRRNFVGPVVGQAILPAAGFQPALRVAERAAWKGGCRQDCLPHNQAVWRFVWPTSKIRVSFETLKTLLFGPRERLGPGLRFRL